MKKMLTLFFLIFVVFTLNAQSHISTQGHQGEVTSIIADFGEEKTFFSTSTDGFIIKWNYDNQGEHYQVSDIPIKLSCLSPDGKTLALYETDGALINRLSVWDFSTLKRKYARRFTDSITTLTFSAQGTYIIAGTTSVNSTVFLRASDGSLISKIKEPTGIVTFISTSASEKTCVAYSPAGTISYYTMQTGKLKSKMQTEDSLTNVVLFNNDMFLSGLKNDQIYIISALNGKTIAKIQSKLPIIFSSPYDSNLYYIERNGKNYALKEVQNNENKSFSNPLTLKTFRILNASKITSASKIQNNIMLGSENGNLYRTQAKLESNVEELVAICDNIYEKIYDMTSSDENDFYFLSKDSLYRSSYDSGIVDKLSEHANYTNISQSSSDIIFWAQNTRKSVLLFNISTKTFTNLFTPKASVQSLKVFGNTILTLEGNSAVNAFYLDSKKSEELYSGAALQDCAIIDDVLYVAKSSSTAPNVPLICVNIKTKEISPIRVSGDIAYSLAASNSMLYGIAIESLTSSKVTKLFSLKPNTAVISTLLRLSDEDANAFTHLHDLDIFTNIGKDKVYSCNIQSKRNLQYDRSASMPLKIAQSGERIASLNKDGSVSWYSLGKSNVLADWYLTRDGTWFEF